MRPEHFEALAPLCPRCLHQRGVAAPLRIAGREEERAGELWHGWLACSDPACGQEYPVIDGVPLIVAEPAAMLQTLAWQALRRDDLPPLLEGMIGDALGPGCEFDTTRQHLSLYGLSHYGDWIAADSGAASDAQGTGQATPGARAAPSPSAAPDASELNGRRAGSATVGPATRHQQATQSQSRPDQQGTPAASFPAAPFFPRPPGAVAVVAAAAETLQQMPEGPVLDLGCGPGRTGWELACQSGRPVLAADLSLTFLRLAQRLRLEGRAGIPLRRGGLIYDRLRLEVPSSHAKAPIDFWALDAQALPFAPASAAALALVNLLDCVPDPTALLAEAARVARPGAPAVLTTPFDWSPAATRPEAWLGGHLRSGASEPALGAATRAVGWTIEASRDGPDWPLRLHGRSEMIYRLHLLLLRRT